MAVQHLQRSASSELPVKLAPFVQQFVYRPDRGQDSVLLAAHPANGGHQSHLTVDLLRETRGGNSAPCRCKLLPHPTARWTIMPVTNDDQPEMRRGQTRRPNLPNANPTAEWGAAEQTAWREAQLTLADGERVFDLRIDTAVAERGNDDVMVYSYSYQVLRPGTTQAVTRYR